MKDSDIMKGGKSGKRWKEWERNRKGENAGRMITEENSYSMTCTSDK